MLLRYQPSQFRNLGPEVNQLQNEMNRLFTRFDDAGNGQRGQFPALNLWEDDDKLYVESELPGLDLSDLEIYVNVGNQLTIKGERKAPTIANGMWHRQERGYSKFARTIELPYAVDDERIEAKFANGVLTIQMPKREEAKPRRIEVKAS